MGLKSIRRHEGVIELDHGDGPGLPPEFSIPVGLPPGTVKGKGKEAFAFYLCPHCQTTVILNPKRSRERGYCRGCDHRLCDECAAHLVLTGKCNNIRHRIEGWQEQAALDEQRGTSPIITSTK